MMGDIHYYIIYYKSPIIIPWLSHHPSAYRWFAMMICWSTRKPTHRWTSLSGWGMVIETKQVCDQERNTEWHNGRCIVSGEKRSPDTCRGTETEDGAGEDTFFHFSRSSLIQGFVFFTGKFIIPTMRYDKWIWTSVFQQCEKSSCHKWFFNGTYGLMVYPWTPAIHRCNPPFRWGCQTPSHIGQIPDIFGCVHGDELLQFLVGQLPTFSEWHVRWFSLDVLLIFAGHRVIFPRKFGWFSPTFHWWPPNFCMACSSEAWGGCSHDSCEESAGRLRCALACIKVLNLWVF